MKWTKVELLNLRENQLDFDEVVEFDNHCFDKEAVLKGLKNVHVSGTGAFGHGFDTFEFDLSIEGFMICPCAITNELVEVPFETYSHEIFSFVDTDEIDVHVVKNEIIELIPVVFQLIHLEIPLKVVKDGLVDYPQGDGWRLMKEEDYEKSKEKEIDPRLAKLKDFKIKND